MIQKATIDFLKALEKNNNKPWFDENRKLYEAAKENIQNITGKLIPVIAAFDDGIGSLQIKDCMFRINRDIRFSKNKTPYKINMGASINRGGKKSIYAGYYFHIEPGGKSFAGGGLWMPMAPELKKIRQEIDYNLDEFTGIVKAKNFVSEYKELENSADLKLINLPRGYDKENPAGEYLKFKSLVATKYLSDDDITGNRIAEKTIKAFKTLMPLVKFINKAIE